MFEVSIEVKGADKVLPFIRKLFKTTEEAIDSNVEYLIKPIVDTAKQLCPVSKPPQKPTFYHGALRDSIKGEKVAPMTGKVHDGVFYGVYQELGFWHPSGKWVYNPFLFPAVQIAYPETTDQLNKLVYSVTKSIKARKG